MSRQPQQRCALCGRVEIVKADDEVTRIEWRYLDTEAGESR